jgi:geranylgeranyl pyrophosphate synthase
MNNDEKTSRLMQVEQRMLDLVLYDFGQIAQAAATHFSSGGSRIRARLALHACHALDVPEGAAIAVAAACELLHNASLVHDDLQDRDVLRRGQQTVWRKHGDATAICVGDLMISAAYAALASLGSAAARLVPRMHGRVSAVIRGQCEDLAQQGGASPSLEVYEAVARGKSGPLLILPLELGLVLAGRGHAIASAEDAAALFAIGYQAADDLEDVDRDALNEELNIVAVLAAAGESRPHDAARWLAIRRFNAAASTAESLPDGCGALLAEQARRRATALAAATAHA